MAGTGEIQIKPPVNMSAMSANEYILKVNAASNAIGPLLALAIQMAIEERNANKLLNATGSPLRVDIDSAVKLAVLTAEGIMRGCRGPLTRSASNTQTQKVENANNQQQQGNPTGETQGAVAKAEEQVQVPAQQPN